MMRSSIQPILLKSRVAAAALSSLSPVRPFANMFLANIGSIGNAPILPSINGVPDGDIKAS